MESVWPTLRPGVLATIAVGRPASGEDARPEDELHVARLVLRTAREWRAQCP